jgi:polyisoprenoid-binding protein YceI
MQSDTRSSMPGVFAAVLALICLAGCPAPPKRSEAPAGSMAGAPPGASGSPGAPGVLGHEGRPYDVESRESLLTILAFRGGALAKAGHNHVIASHDLTGTFYVPDEPLRSTFELHIPVAQLTIDEPELRSREGPDFPTDVPDSAKEGTRHNMLSEALLNGAQYPEITLVAQRIDGAANPATVRADVQVTVRGQARLISVPVSYTLAKGELIATGELPIRQTDLGLTPFSALLGALQVQDELRVRFRIVARQAQTRRS